MSAMSFSVGFSGGARVLGAVFGVALLSACSLDTEQFSFSGAGGASSGGSGTGAQGGAGTGASGGSATGAQGGAGNDGGTGGSDPCGNGQPDPGETCDGDCPTACVHPDLCISREMQGSPDTCDVVCPFDPIITCTADDGCCPSGCAESNDKDCSLDVMVIGADPDVNHADNVAAALATTGNFGTITTFNANNQAVPPAAQLAQHEAVLVFVFGGLGDAAPLGDALADFHDSGGKVVLTNGANCHQTYRLRGRFEDEGYHVLEEGGVYPNPDTLGAVLVPDSPLMVGVDEVETTTIHCATSAVPGAEVIATYQDTLDPIVVVGQVGGRNRVDVNVYVATGGDLLSPDIVTLLSNALLYPGVP